MTPPGPVTLSLVAERIEQVQATLERVERNQHTINEQALDRRVTSLESNMKWIARALGGAIIAAIGSGGLALIMGR